LTWRVIDEISVWEQQVSHVEREFLASFFEIKDENLSTKGKNFTVDLIFFLS